MSKDTELFEIITQRIKKIFQRIVKIKQRDRKLSRCFIFLI